MRRILAIVLATTIWSAVPVRADAVLDWNAIAISTLGGQNPFNQARLMAITQLAVFEAVNAITGQYEPYLGTIVAPAGASADAAAIAAAHTVLKNYVPSAGAALDAARAASLAAIPDGTAKTNGIATGEAAAAAMIAARASDGSSPPAFYLPSSSDPYQWQLTPGCSAAGGLFRNWPNVTPFGIEDAAAFVADPPPLLTSSGYAKAFNEVKRFGSKTSTDRPQDRTDVARFYAATSPASVMNMAGRQLSAARADSLSENARAFALINMAISDAAVASFTTKYRYTTWRPETAIHDADLDNNPKTDADPSWTPLIVAPCFPGYTSNHGGLSNAGAEVLRRLYGAGGHAITITNAAFPTLVYHYAELKQITDDISDARVYGGIHFRFDQDAGADLGRAVGTAVYKNNLRVKDRD